MLFIVKIRVKFSYELWHRGIWHCPSTSVLNQNVNLYSDYDIHFMADFELYLNNKILNNTKNVISPNDFEVWYVTSRAYQLNCYLNNTRIFRVRARIIKFIQKWQMREDLLIPTCWSFNWIILLTVHIKFCKHISHAFHFDESTRS